MIHEFWLDDVSCTEYGMMVQKFPPISRAKERVQTVTIPGRSGTLTLLQGQDVYDAYTKTCTCAIKENADLSAICEWLRGGHRVRFGNEPEFEYECRVANQADLLHLFNGGWTQQVQIPFFVQPLKRQYPHEEKIILTSSGTSVINPANVAAHPIMIVEIDENAAQTDGVVDDIQLTITNALGAESITIVGAKKGQKIVLDWAAQDCYEWETNANFNNKIVGNPQRFQPDENTVSWSGAIDRVVIDPQWRWA